MCTHLQKLASGGLRYTVAHIYKTKISSPFSARITKGKSAQPDHHGYGYGPLDMLDASSLKALLRLAGPHSPA